MVCHASTLMGREKNLGRKIRDLTVCLSLGLGVISLACRDSLSIFLFCMGREENFKFDMENFAQQPVGGNGIRLSFFHPFRLIVNTAAFAFIFVVPILYHKIFKFRKMQDKSIRGISKHI